MATTVFKRVRKAFMANFGGIINIFFMQILLPFVIILTLYKLAPGNLWYPGMPLNDWLTGLGYNGTPNGSSGAICWSCNIFRTFNDTFFYLGNYFQTFFLDFCKIFLFISTAAWLLYEKVFKSFWSIAVDGNTDIDANQFYKDIFTKLAKVSLVIVALTAIRTQQVVDYGVMPIMEAGTGISSKIMNADVCKRIATSSKVLKNDNNPNGYVNDMNEELFCAISSYDAMLISGISAGKTIFQANVLTNPIAIFVGLLLIAIFTMLFLIVPLGLIDIIFNIGLLMIYLPFMLMGYAFNTFENFGSKAIPIFKYLALKLVIFSITLSIIYVTMFKIADYYFPRGNDNFSYLFPNYFVMQNLDDNSNIKSTQQIAAENYFKTCLGTNDFTKELKLGEKRFSDEQITGCFRSYFTATNQKSINIIELIPIIFTAFMALVMFSQFDNYMSGLIGDTKEGVGLGIKDTVKSLFNSAKSKLLDSKKISNFKVNNFFKKKK